MKLIPLTQGKFAQVDDDDYEYLVYLKWHTIKSGKTHYAVNRGSGSHKTRKNVYMHRLIKKINEKKIQIDHKDGNGLNNQKHNLRECNQSQNNINRIYTKSRSSHFIGVVHRIKINKYEATIGVNYKNKYLGKFIKEIDAAKAYNEAALKYYGEFARLNQI